MEEINYGHKPVLLHECLDALAIKPDGVYLDGTLGRAGHSLEIVRRLTAGGRLIALDRDETAIEAAQRRLADYMDRVTLVHSNFSALDDVLRELGVRGVDGMLFDLGVSSPQLDDAARGFSYKQDAPLDMRMDESASYTARELVNTVSYEELKRILYEYGEERYAPAIAKKICAYRTEKPIETTLELADLIRSAMPAAALREKQHPAKRSFQAIRIAVNDELGELPPMLRAAEKNLKPGGRLAVITFHSLEDRIVKRELQALATGCTCPPEFPVCVCGKKPKMKLITRKPIVSGEEEKKAVRPRVRERQRVSGVLVLGFAALAAMVVVVLMSYAQLTSISADVVSMQKELKTLDAEHVALLTQYERTFDLETVKAAAVAAGMNKPSSSQINYIDLSAPDSVELCEAQNVSVLSRVFTSLGQGVFSVVEYFS